MTVMTIRYHDLLKATKNVTKKTCLYRFASFINSIHQIQHHPFTKWGS